MPRLRTFAARRWLPAGWGLLSAGGLAVADRIDPYVLGAAAMVAAPVSCAVVAIAFFGGWRAVALALLAAVPTLFAFHRLSTIHWA